MKHGSLFSGIGGFDLAAQYMGWENVFHCEWNNFGKKILKYYWPKAISYDDITKTDFTIHRGRIDILSGGFPCQPYSTAGKRLGKADDRHLWPEMLRAIREIEPRWVVGENVFGLVNWNGGMVFDEVQADLEAQGYEVQSYVLPAASVNAPHKRDRVWFVARNTNASDTDSSRSEKSRFQQSDIYTRSSRNNIETTENSLRSRCAHGGHEQEGAEVREQRDIGARNYERIQADNEKTCNVTNPNEWGWWESYGFNNTESKESNKIGKNGNASDSSIQGLQRCEVNRSTGECKPLTEQQPSRFFQSKWEVFPTQSPICGGDDGLPSKLDGITFSKWRNESIKGYGNAVVPQVVHQIFKVIEQYETHKNEHL